MKWNYLQKIINSELNYLQKIIKGPALLSLVQVVLFVHHALIKIKDDNYLSSNNVLIIFL